MNQLLDFLFLRRPKLDYICPPICEVIFTGSGGPIITLEDLERLLGPTGFKLGGRGNHWLSWNNYPGIICFNLYFSPSGDPSGPFELINECVPPSSVLVCSAGFYRIVTHFSNGDPDLLSNWGFIDGSVYVQLNLPQVENASSYDILWAPPDTPNDPPTESIPVFAGILPGGNAVETCEPGCYRITILVPLGETPPTEAICEDFIPQICIPPTIYDPIRRMCVLPGQCYEVTCGPGFHFDQDSCDCISDGGCSPFIDDITPLVPPTEYDNGGSPFSSQNTVPATGGLWGGSFSTDNRPAFYFNRVSQLLDNIGAIHPGETGALTACNANKQVGGTQDNGILRDVFWIDIDAAIVRNVGQVGAPSGLTTPFKIIANGKMWMGKYRSSQLDGCSIYDPLTDTLLSGLEVPFQLGTQVYDVNDSEVMAGRIIDLGGVTHAVTMVESAGSLVKTFVILPGDAAASVGDFAFKINSTGNVLGLWFDPVNFPKLFVSGPGGINSIPTDNTFQYAQYGFLNENNETAFTVADTITGFSKGGWWSLAGGLTLFGADGVNTTVDGFNSSGFAVGATDGKAYIYRPGIGLTLLTALILPATGWTTFDQVWGISDDNFLFGSGTFNGNPSDFAAKLCF